MNRKLLSVLLVLILVLSSSLGVLAVDVGEPGSGNSTVDLTAEAARFSVTVPTSLILNVDSTGVVTTATNAKLVNNGHGAVKVTGVNITSAPGWEVVSFETDMSKEKVGAKKIGFSINGCETVGDSILFDAANFQRLDGSNPTDSDELEITYTAKLPAQNTAIEGLSIAEVVFTVDWDE